MGTPRIAVVGAGPAGFFSCKALLDQGFEVDLFDLLPSPFGLVRAGVAPDHAKIKDITVRFEQTASQRGFRFFGGVEFGVDVSRSDLRERYHAVIYAVGTPSDNRLGIPGEDRPGSHAATEFVAWYNGHPHHADHDFDLSAERAVVIGNGNVAIDVARMLVLGRSALSRTDTADHAIEALATSSVRHVVILGRRSAAQAAFTTPELLELGELADVDVVVNPHDVRLDKVSADWLALHGDRNARRNLEVLTEYSQRSAEGRRYRIEFRFLQSPVEIVGSGEAGPVTGLRVCRNTITADPEGRPCALPISEEEEIPCGLVLRSIGYRGVALPDVPFDERRGVIRNDGGRVIDEEGLPHRGEYAVGWIKRGATGVLGTNKKDATETVGRLVADFDEGRLNNPVRPASGSEVENWLRATVPGLVSWAGWKAVDAHETEVGQRQGRPRVKVVSVDEMVTLARGIEQAD